MSSSHRQLFKSFKIFFTCTGLKRKFLNTVQHCTTLCIFKVVQYCAFSTLYNPVHLQNCTTLCIFKVVQYCAFSTLYNTVHLQNCTTLCIFKVVQYCAFSTLYNKHSTSSKLYNTVQHCTKSFRQIGEIFFRKVQFRFCSFSESFRQ